MRKHAFKDHRPILTFQPPATCWRPFRHPAFLIQFLHLARFPVVGTPSCDSQTEQSSPKFDSNIDKPSRADTYGISSCDSKNVTCIPSCSNKSDKSWRPDTNVISSCDSQNETCIPTCSNKSDKPSNHQSKSYIRKIWYWLVISNIWFISSWK